MAFYIKKDRNAQNQDDRNSGKVSPEMRPFYKILGCVIVLVIAMIIWAVKG